MPKKKINHRSLRAKLIFNEISGRTDESPQQLTEILTEMQNLNILPEVYMVHPDSQIESVVRSAIKGGTNLIVVAGGDGTIDSVVGAMIGTSATTAALKHTIPGDFCLVTRDDVERLL